MGQLSVDTNGGSRKRHNIGNVAKNKPNLYRYTFRDGSVSRSLDLVALSQLDIRPEKGRHTLHMTQDGRVIARIANLSPPYTHSKPEIGICKGCGREFTIFIGTYAGELLLNAECRPKKTPEFCGEACEAKYKRRQADERRNERNKKRNTRRRKEPTRGLCVDCGQIEIEKRAGARRLCPRCLERTKKREQRARAKGATDTP